MFNQRKNKYHIWIRDEREPKGWWRAATITGHDLALEFGLFLAVSRKVPVWITAEDNRVIHKIPGG